jgi:hypothetical protein
MEATTDLDSSVASTARRSERKSQATKIVDLAQEDGIELWHTPKGEPYMTIVVGAHREHHSLQSTAIRNWLSRSYFTRTRSSPGEQAIKDALNTLGGIAQYEGDQHDVHVRVGSAAGTVYLDLGDRDWRVVAITAEGWSVIDESPVRFRRPAAMLALPTPQVGGSIDAVREVVHVERDEDWTLILAWLVGALRHDGPYPVLGLDGEQGSGKSTTARMLRRLIDPNAADLRAEPRELRDLMIAASSGRIVALDNLSYVPPWLSDALCRISTGGAFSTRVLYTDGEEHLIEAIRPTIITGITPVITRRGGRARWRWSNLPVLARRLSRQALLARRGIDRSRSESSFPPPLPAQGGHPVTQCHVLRVKVVLPGQRRRQNGSDGAQLFTQVDQGHRHLGDYFSRSVVGDGWKSRECELDRRLRWQPGRGRDDAAEDVPGAGSDRPCWRIPGGRHYRPPAIAARPASSLATSARMSPSDMPATRAALRATTSPAGQPTA